MITAKRRFGFLIVCAILALGCFGLSYWQWQRLEWKTALLSQLQNQSAVTLNAANWDDAVLPYRLLKFAGTVDQTKVFFRPAAVNPNAPAGSDRLGYDLWLPVVLGQGKAVIVNYGWIDQAMRDRLLSQAPDASNFKSEITGWWVPQQPQPSFAPANNAAKNEWYWPDVAELTTITGYDLAPGIVYNQANWFGGENPPLAANIPNNHRQYAWTWLLLGLVNVAGGLYYWLGDKGRGNTERL
jgi:surfeit locus 1 family protein